MSNKPEYSIFDLAEIPCEEISDSNVLVKEPLASACMVTYNHAPYIAQAIQGVLQQETNFPYELVIGEDCSTDGTREIVFEYQKKYPDIIRVITSEHNVGAHKNALRSEKACRGKYITICDGDDYWHHSHKLQKQVDFLESNPDYGMVHSDYDNLIDRTGKIIRSINKQNNKKIPADNFFEELLVNNFIGTLTVCARSKLVKQAIVNNCRHYEKWMIGDRPLWMEISRHSKIGYIDESLAVYRRLEESASNSSNRRRRLDFQKSSYDIRFHFIEKYGCSAATQATVLRQYHRMLLHDSFFLYDRETARQSFEFLKNSENDKKQRKVNFHYYLGSKNRLNWIFVRVCMKVKKELSNCLAQLSNHLHDGLRVMQR